MRIVSSPSSAPCGRLSTKSTYDCATAGSLPYTGASCTPTLSPLGVRYSTAASVAWEARAFSAREGCRTTVSVNVAPGAGARSTRGVAGEAEAGAAAARTRPAAAPATRRAGRSISTTTVPTVAA